jgi:hypothetical protein
MRLAQAAVESPYGPAPTISSGVRSIHTVSLLPAVARS